jgi:hypothetical protein
LRALGRALALFQDTKDVVDMGATVELCPTLGSNILQAYGAGLGLLPPKREWFRRGHGPVVIDGRQKALVMVVLQYQENFTVWARYGEVS